MTERWWTKAACAGLPTEMFFPGEAHAGVEALAICAACPVRVECLDEAMALPYQADHGIRGGERREQRLRLRAAAPPPKPPTIAERVEELVMASSVWWTKAELASELGCSLPAVQAALSEMVARGDVEAVWPNQQRKHFRSIARQETA